MDCLFGLHGMYGFMHFLNQVLEIIEEETEFQMLWKSANGVNLL